VDRRPLQGVRSRFRQDSPLREDPEGMPRLVAAFQAAKINRSRIRAAEEGDAGAGQRERATKSEPFDPWWSGLPQGLALPGHHVDKLPQAARPDPIHQILDHLDVLQADAVTPRCRCRRGTLTGNGLRDRRPLRRCGRASSRSHVVLGSTSGSGHAWRPRRERVNFLSSGSTTEPEGAKEVA